MYTHNKKFIIIASLISITLICFLLILLFLEGQTKKKVTIISSPSSASFKIGDITGKTPATIELKSGTFNIEISHKDYKNLKTSFSIAPLKKSVSLNYSLSILPPEAIGTGGGYMQSPAEVAKKVNDYNDAYPYASQLPVQAKDYYISAPYEDGTMHVYIFREREAQSKAEVYKWFSDHGAADPQSLKINWVYDNKF